MTIEIFHQTKDKNVFDYHSFVEKNKDCTFVCLIDNYHFQYQESIIPLDLQNKIDVIVFEKSLTKIADQIIAKLGNVKKNRVYLKGSSILLKKDNKYTCQILTASFYMCRLGFFDYPQDSIVRTNKETQKPHILNVLSKKYQRNEERVLKILSHLIDVSCIEYHFYDDWN